MLYSYQIFGSVSCVPSGVCGDRSRSKYTARVTATRHIAIRLPAGTCDVSPAPGNMGIDTSTARGRPLGDMTVAGGIAASPTQLSKGVECTAFVIRLPKPQ